MDKDTPTWTKNNNINNKFYISFPARILTLNWIFIFNEIYWKCSYKLKKEWCFQKYGTNIGKFLRVCSLWRNWLVLHWHWFSVLLHCWRDFVGMEMLKCFFRHCQSLLLQFIIGCLGALGNIACICAFSGIIHWF